MNKNTIISVIVLLLIVAGAAWLLTRESNSPLEVQNTNTSATQTNSQMLDVGSKLPIMTQSVQYAPGTDGFFAKPEAEGTYPGVVMIHEWWGLNQNIKDMAEQLAKEGYMVLAVDLYDGKVASTSEEAQQLVGQVRGDQAAATQNLKQAVNYLRNDGATKVASLGWCFGGGQSLQLSLAEPLDATVIYYGQLVTDKQQLANVKWPVLGIFGETDTSIPVAQVNEFDVALDSLGITNSIHIYPGVGHAFANPSGQSYSAEATKDAWGKTVMFLDQHLKGIRSSAAIQELLSKR